MQDEKLLLEELYAGKKYLTIRFTGSKYQYNLLLLGRDKEPDCYITSFSANFYMRTLYGETRKKYTTYKGMLKAVRKRLDNVFGDKNEITELNIVEVNEKDGYPMF